MILPCVQVALEEGEVVNLNRTTILYNATVDSCFDSQFRKAYLILPTT